MGFVFRVSGLAIESLSGLSSGMSGNSNPKFLQQFKVRLPCEKEVRTPSSSPFNRGPGTLFNHPTPQTLIKPKRCRV